VVLISDALRASAHPTGLRESRPTQAAPVLFYHRGRNPAEEDEMSENVDNLILEHLRMLRNEVAGLRTEMQEEFRDVKLRLAACRTLESSAANRPQRPIFHRLFAP